MVTNVGATTSQGVVQHRVDKLPAGIDGVGITVGVMSDSYDTERDAPTQRQADVATGDLPGAGNPSGNTQPVVVLQDSPAARTKAARCCRSCTTWRRRRASGSRRRTAARSTSPTTSARSPGFPGAPHAWRGSRRTSSSTTSSIWPSRSSRTASSRRQSMKWPRRACRTSPRPATPGDAGLRLEGAHRARDTRVLGRHQPRTSRVPELYAGGFHNFDGGSERRHRADDPVRRRTARSSSSGTSRSIRSRRHRSVRRSPRAWARCRRAAIPASRSTARRGSSSRSSSMRTTRRADAQSRSDVRPDRSERRRDPVRRYDHESGVADSRAAPDGAYTVIVDSFAEPVRRFPVSRAAS